MIQIVSEGLVPLYSCTLTPGHVSDTEVSLIEHCMDLAAGEGGYGLLRLVWQKARRQPRAEEVRLV